MRVKKPVHICVQAFSFTYRKSLVLLGLQVFLNLIQSPFFQAADLRLGDADFRRNLHLGQPFDEAEIENPLFAIG